MLYDRPVRELLAECVQQLREPFTRAEVLAWFQGHYPSVRATTISTQLAALTEGANPDSVPGLAGFRPLVRRVARGLYVRAGGAAGPEDESSSGAFEELEAVQEPAPVGVVATRRAPADVVLVGCVKSKAQHATAARDLYKSPLFTRRRRYAEATGRPWFIVSSRWGLVAPEEVIAPYDVYLADQPASFRRAWGIFVAAQLHSARGSLSGQQIEVHAGDAYVAALREPLEHLGATVLDPVEARSMGETLAWYGRHSRGSRAALAARAQTAVVEEALVSLGQRSRGFSASDLELATSEALNGPGLYVWWVDDTGSRDLARGLGLPLEPGLIYAGQAGATRWPSGRASRNTLRTRLVDMHLCGRAEFSTFRRTLAACLRDPLGLRHEDDARLDSWIRTHLAVTVWPTAGADELGAIEELVLAALDPPLNLRGMAASAVRARLSALRQSRG